MVVKIYRTFANQFFADVCMPYHKGLKDRNQGHCGSQCFVRHACLYMSTTGSS